MPLLASCSAPTSEPGAWPGACADGVCWLTTLRLPANHGSCLSAPNHRAVRWGWMRLHGDGLGTFSEASLCWAEGLAFLSRMKAVCWNILLLLSAPALWSPFPDTSASGSLRAGVFPTELGSKFILKSRHLYWKSPSATLRPRGLRTHAYTTTRKGIWLAGNGRERSWTEHTGTHLGKASNHNLPRPLRMSTLPGPSFKWGWRLKDAH